MSLSSCVCTAKAGPFKVSGYTPNSYAPTPIRYGLSLLLCILYGVGGSFQPALAATVENFDTDISIKARELNTDVFLKTLFSEIGVPVVVDDNIVGTVTGNFNNSATDIFNDVAKSSQLILYYDGALAYVYSASEVSTTVLQIPEIIVERVIDHAEKLELLDPHNSLVRSEHGGLAMTGVPRFVVQVKELAASLQSTSTDSEAPYITLSFILKYASAIDRHPAGKTPTTIPGVATILRGLVNPGSLPGSNVIAKSQKKSASPHSAALIVAEPLNNAVIIRDRADLMARYKRLIDALDVKQNIIAIQSTVIDLDFNRLQKLGMDVQFGEGSDGMPGSNAAALVLKDGAEFIDKIRSLHEHDDTAVRIVSQPYVSTMSNVEALVETGETRSNSVSNVDGDHAAPVKAGMALRITPRVFESNNARKFKLDVHIKNSVMSDLQADRNPEVQASMIDTEAVINAGESLLIGGMVRDVKSKIVTKVPLLGDIPIIGALFRNHSYSTNQVERVVLITPRVL